MMGDALSVSHSTGHGSSDRQMLESEPVLLLDFPTFSRGTHPLFFKATSIRSYQGKQSGKKRTGLDPLYMGVVRSIVSPPRIRERSRYMLIVYLLLFFPLNFLSCKQDSCLWQIGRITN